MEKLPQKEFDDLAPPIQAGQAPAEGYGTQQQYAPPQPAQQYAPPQPAQQYAPPQSPQQYTSQQYSQQNMPPPAAQYTPPPAAGPPVIRWENRMAGMAIGVAAFGATMVIGFILGALLSGFSTSSAGAALYTGICLGLPYALIAVGYTLYTSSGKSATMAYAWNLIWKLRFIMFLFLPTPTYMGFAEYDVDTGMINGDVFPMLPSACIFLGFVLYFVVARKKLKKWRET